MDTDSDIEHVLAHEHRHHWQLLSGWEYDAPNYTDGSPVRDYFTTSRSELDAELFALKLTSSKGYRDALELPAITCPAYFDITKPSNNAKSSDLISPMRIRGHKESFYSHKNQRC